MTGGVTGRVVVGETLTVACRLVLERTSELFRVGLLPIIGIFIIGIATLDYLWPMAQTQVPQMGGAAAGQPMPDPRLLPVALLVLLGELLVIAVFAVGWHRLILLGPRAGGGLGIGIGRREMACFGRLWLCLLGMVAASFAVAMAEIMLASLLRANTLGFVLFALPGYYLVVGYVIGRIGLTFAGISVDQRFNFNASWEATRGQGLRILAIYLLIAVAWLVVNILFGFLAGLLGLGEAAPYAFMFIGAVLSIGFMAVLVTVNAILFRRLSGWSPNSLQPAGT
jgi:hypothetical protein